MAEKSTYSIRELEELSGVPAHTIRTWERRYQLLCPVRDAGNTRCYGKEVAGYLRHLAVLLRHGHRISILAGKSRDEIAMMAQEYVTPMADEITESLCHAMQDYNLSRLEGLMSCYVRKEGFETALREHFIPFLDQLSFLLVSGALQPAQGQLFYTVLRQKIFSAMEQLSPPKDAEKWLLLHGKGDAEAIHRDILQYALRSRDKQVIRIDASQTSDVGTLVREIQPHVCCIVADTDPALLQRMVFQSTLAGQGNTLVFTPGKTLDFVNNPQISAIPVLYGLPAAFNYLQSRSFL